jgi:hypothetical protein
MRMAHLTTRSILLRKPQYRDYLVGKTCARPSSRELNAGVHYRGTYQVHMEPCLHGHQLQYNERIRRWFNSPVEKGWRVGEKAMEK